ncbi:long-chain-fatty-acid--CoA ligase [Pseudomonas sp. J452]|uniref:long-chain-fatty-acid--CoA ligase n=1 Tax=Pseudomonas sp. J452 TaxID=2898441 RepID=UPI0021ADCBE0|nr:long-chain-fatty-acid--CoA ligase [Pseudomonas sp. J452]UUY08295.1 long-chain-fatty-acid--CoA ligase [Pseudomonas sp. J452]
MQLTQALHRAAQLYPERTATVFRERRRTYRESAERVARLAGGLHNLGITKGERVSVLAVNSDHYQEAMLACWWLGAVLNPVNTRWSAAEIAYSLDDCGATLLVVDDQHLPLLPGILAGVERRPMLLHAGMAQTPSGALCMERLLASAEPIADSRSGGDDLAVIMYTGGTTGRPKGVMLSHAALLITVLLRLAEQAPLAKLVGLNVAPMFHIAGLAVAYARVVSGDTNVYIPGFEPVELLETLCREQVNETLLVPTMLQALLVHPRFAEFDLGCLRHILYGASPISSALLDKAMAQLPQADFMQVYGLTENTGLVSFNPPANHGAEARAAGLHRSVGRPVCGQWVKVVDSQGEQVPRRAIGELLVSGPTVMQGYWNKPEETAKVLKDGWLCTGDAAYMDEDGHLFIVDRVKDMIISGGENVYSAEVENVLATHPAVALCAVIGIPHDTWGEAVHAAVVLKPGAEVGAAELQAHCRAQIAGYKCPKSVEFREAMPLSAAGKILKRDLREPHWVGR